MNSEQIQTAPPIDRYVDCIIQVILYSKIRRVISHLPSNEIIKKRKKEKRHVKVCGYSGEKKFAPYAV